MTMQMTIKEYDLTQEAIILPISPQEAVYLRSIGSAVFTEPGYYVAILGLPPIGPVSSHREALAIASPEHITLSSVA